MEFPKGAVVVSLKGRDKKRLMCVVGVSAQGVMVCDGKERPLLRPKLKNPKHVRAIGIMLNESQTVTDKSIRKALKLIPEA